MLKIACIGIAVQDRLYYLSDLPTNSGKYVANQYREMGGGPAATAAVAVSRLGAEVDFIGRVGGDDCGGAIISELESYGVNCRYTQRIENARSSQSAILVDGQGERAIINAPSPDLPESAEWLNEIDFSCYDLVLADVRWHQGAELGFTLAKKVGVPTLLDADVTPQDILPLVELADHIAFSEPGLKRCCPQSDITKSLQTMSERVSGTLYVTAGSTGCYYLADNQLNHQSAFEVKVVDTTGAGDVFHGALAYALASGNSLADSVKMACATAALKCTKPGGRIGIPDSDQIRTFLSTYV